jgi:hypothetical protein
MQSPLSSWHVDDRSDALLHETRCEAQRPQERFRKLPPHVVRTVKALPGSSMASARSLAKIWHSTAGLLQNCNFCRCIAGSLHFFQRHMQAFGER